MQAADCLLLTSVLEGSPNVVKEAVTCSLPVVTTDVGDVRRVLAGVEPSWICRADQAQLGAALADCLSAPRRSNGWERSVWLSDSRIRHELLDLYSRLVSGGLDTTPRLTMRAVALSAHEHGGAR
jgi:glycosyltransferase involved in cell wall biosynthesis